MAEQSGVDQKVSTKKRTKKMTTTYRTRVGMAQKNQQTVKVKQQVEQKKVQKETPKFCPECNICVCSLCKTKFKMAHQQPSVLKQRLKQRVQQQLKPQVEENKVQKETPKLCPDSEMAIRSLSKHKQFMSTEWNVLPFALPENEDNLPKSKTINEILTLSLKQQKKCELDDAKSSFFVTIVVSRCLDAMKIVHKLDSGVRCINDTNIPHMWLVIDGYIIDNIYTQDINSQSLEYLCKNTPTCYKSFDFSQPETLTSYLKPKIKPESIQKTIDCLKRIIDFWTTEPDKCLALDLNEKKLRDYYFSVMRHMDSKFHVSVSGIDPKIRCVCWGCGCYPRSGRPFLSDIEKPEYFKEADTPSKTTWKFPKCSRCLVANYCSAECQNADWLDNHRFNCVSRADQTNPPCDIDTI